MAHLRGAAAPRRDSRLHPAHQRAPACRPARLAGEAARHRYHRLARAGTGRLAPGARRNEWHAVSPHRADAVFARPGVLRLGAHRRKRYAGRGGPHDSWCRPLVAVSGVAANRARPVACPQRRRITPSHGAVEHDPHVAAPGAGESGQWQRQGLVGGRREDVRRTTRRARHTGHVGGHCQPKR